MSPNISRRESSFVRALLPLLLSGICLAAAAITPPTHHHQHRHPHHRMNETHTATSLDIVDDAEARTDFRSGTRPAMTERLFEETTKGDEVDENVQADDWRLRTTTEGEMVLEPDDHQANIILNPASHIRLGTVSFTSTGAIKGERGEAGSMGPEGRRGNRGIPGPTGQKGEPGDQISFNGPLNVNFATTADICTEPDIGRVRIDEVGDSLEICTGRGWRSIGSGNKPRTLRRSCLELMFFDGITESGLYWINPSYGKDTQHAVRVYCDMTTAGGGWTLIAKVSDHYRWICPEQRGANCERSAVDPLRANLFHQAHERDLVDLHGSDNDSESGVHVSNSVARYIFKTGRKHLRFSFVGGDASEDSTRTSTTNSDPWRFSEDAYAAFQPEVEQVLFKDGTWALYSKENLSYSWNVIRHERRELTFNGDVICWGNKVATPYRYHEGGLHMGIPSSSLPCQLAINPQAVMLKSIYAAVGENGNSQWVEGQRSYIGDGSMAAVNQRVAIWVR